MNFWANVLALVLHLLWLIRRKFVSLFSILFKSKVSGKLLILPMLIFMLPFMWNNYLMELLNWWRKIFASITWYVLSITGSYTHPITKCSAFCAPLWRSMMLWLKDASARQVSLSSERLASPRKDSVIQLIINMSQFRIIDVNARRDSNSKWARLVPWSVFHPAPKIPTWKMENVSSARDSARGIPPRSNVFASLTPRPPPMEIVSPAHPSPPSTLCWTSASATPDSLAEE